MSLFRDRVEAGQKLAAALEPWKDRQPVVLGLVRGGLVLAREIAQAFNAPLDVVVARKVGAPHHPEYGIGAIAPGGVRVHDERALSRLYISQHDFNRLADAEREELERRTHLYRGDLPRLHLEGKSAIVVDDGLATGYTALAAVRYVRTLDPEALVMAAPVCTEQARQMLVPEVDEVVCLEQPEPFYAVGQWYDDFAQVEDDEVLQILRECRSQTFLA